MNKNLFLLFLLVITSFYSCKKDAPDPVVPDPVSQPAQTIVIPVYFKGLIGNSMVSLETNFLENPILDSVSNIRSGASEVDFGKPATPFIHSSTITSEKARNKQNITVYFVSYFNRSELHYNGSDFRYQDKMQFENVFSPGSRNFKYDFSDYTGRSVAIKFVDENGITWTTSKNYGIETGFDLPKTPNFRNAQFEVISRTTFPQEPLIEENSILVKVKFDCHLYNIQGDSIHLKNAEFQGFYHNYWVRY